MTKEDYKINKDFQEQCSEGNINTMKDMLKKHKEIDVNFAGSFGWTALHLAIFKSREESVKLLLKHGADVNIQSEDGKSALIWAVRGKNPDIFLMILKDKNIRMGVEDNDKHSVFWYLNNSATSSIKEAYNKFLEDLKNKKKIGKYADLLR